MKARHRMLALAALVTLAAAVLGSGFAVAESNMNRIREKAEEFTQSWLKADLKHRAEGKPAKYDRVCKDFGYLFSPSKISDINDTIEKTTDADERRALELLRGLIEQQIVIGQLAGNLDEVGNFELEQETELPGLGQIPFRELRSMMVGEPKRKLRKLAYVVVTDTYSIANVYQNQIIATSLDAVHALGFSSYPEMRSRHQGIDYSGLRTYCEALLDETAGDYQQQLAERAETVLDVGASKVRRYDLEFLTLSSEMDAALGKVQAKKVWQILGGNLGLPRWGKVAQIELNTDRQASTWGDVYPLQLQRKIIASARRRGETANLAFALQCFGRIMRDLNLTTRQWEFRRLASRPLDLAAGYLFEDLLAEPAFATSVLGLDDTQATDLQRSRRFAELLLTRMDAASFLFELLLYDDFKLAQPKFNPHMEEALKVKFLMIDSELYLEDYTFAAADRLLGRQLAAHFRDVLRNRFGAAWWTDPQAGEFLRTLWADGSRLSFEDLSADYGFTLFDTAPIVQEMTAAHTGS